jgi:hypothetical protein
MARRKIVLLIVIHPSVCISELPCAYTLRGLSTAVEKALALDLSSQDKLRVGQRPSCRQYSHRLILSPPAGLPGKPMFHVPPAVIVLITAAASLIISRAMAAALIICVVRPTDSPARRLISSRSPVAPLVGGNPLNRVIGTFWP